MIFLVGQLSLCLALLFSIFQSFIPLLGFYQKNPYLLAFARPSAIGQFAFVLCAYTVLTIAFATNDFSILYVANNSHPNLPPIYRLTAVWGAHEGSILLWIVLLSLWTQVVACVFNYKKKYSDLLPLTLAILGLISFSFLIFLLLTSNPFIRISDLITPKDLNPLLQDPGFISHPPMLYTGYVGFSVAFAITQAALLLGKLDNVWASITRKFALAAFCFLTLGIMLGSLWAYRVLGWGGFWFWDPVENASLLPWLSGVALIHILVIVEKRHTSENWAALLSILTFALSLLGTFLVRSGVLISVHTFANDPKRGLFLLISLAVILFCALLVYVLNIKNEKSSQSIFSMRELLLWANSALLIIAMLTILLGTLYPLILDTLQLGSISVGAPYFNLILLPLVFIVMALMGFVPFVPWQEKLIHTWRMHLIKNAVLSFLISSIITWFLISTFNLTSFFTLTLSNWIILSVLHTRKKLPAMSFAHLGFSILIIGVILSSLLNEERDVKMKPGDMTTVGPYQFLFIDTKGIQGSNYRGIAAAFEVTKNNRHITNLYPEKRIYLARDMVMTKVAIHPGLFRDLYLALGEPLNDPFWSLRIYYKPFIRWIWLGGLLMMMGGMIGVIGRKREAQNP